MHPAQLIRSIAVLLACLTCAPAAAVDGYLAVSIGRSTVQHWNARDINVDGSVSGTSGQDSDTAVRLAIGYGLSDNFTLEFGHLDLGQATARGTSDGTGGGWAPGPISVKAAVKGYDLGFVARMPMSDRFALVARIGAFMWTLKSSARDASNARSQEDGGSEAYLGGGLQFVASQSVALRGDFTRYSVDILDIHVMSISAIWHMP